MKSRSFLSFFLTSAVLFAGILVNSGAADATASKKTKEDDGITAESIAAQPYVPITMDNISRTLWSMNALSLDNSQAVDDFLKITECDLYKRFFLNEFEWKKIREATRSYLSKYKSAFPRKYEYIQPVMLDRYDFDLKGFSIAGDSVFNSTTKLELGVSLHVGSKCQDRGMDAMPGYPTSAMLTMRKPFQLSFVRVNEEIAKEYLKMLDDKKIDTVNGRPAYARFRVRLENYLGEDRFEQGVYGNFSGSLESIEVFADRELMFKIYEQSLY